MPRSPRRFQGAAAACFPLLDRGHTREAIFAEDEDRRVFLTLVGRYQERFGFQLYQDCLLPNDFPLLVRLADPRQVSPLLAGLLRGYVHHRHRRWSFVGHCFQGRFKSPAIQEGASALSWGRYRERNPVEAGLTALPWEYAWSSCRAYSLGESDRWLDGAPASTELSPAPAPRQARWRAFLVGDDPRAEAVRRGDGAVGDDAFRLLSAQGHGRPGPQRSGWPAKEGGRPPGRITSAAAARQRVV